MKKTVAVTAGLLLVVAFAAIAVQRASEPVVEVASPAAADVQRRRAEPRQASRPKEGGAYDFTLKNLDGRSVTLSDFRGKKLVVLDFWTTWCGPCRMAMPELNAFGGKFPDRVEILSVNQQEPRDKVAGYINSKPWDFLHVVLDSNGEVSRAYRVYGIPTLYVVNLEGQVCFKHVGYRRGLDTYLVEMVKQHCGVSLGQGS